MRLSHVVFSLRMQKAEHLKFPLNEVTLITPVIPISEHTLLVHYNQCHYPQLP